MSLKDKIFNFFFSEKRAVQTKAATQRQAAAPKYIQPFAKSSFAKSQKPQFVARCNRQLNAVPFDNGLTGNGLKILLLEGLEGLNVEERQANNAL